MDSTWIGAAAVKAFVWLGGLAAAGTAVAALVKRGTKPVVRAGVHWMVGENHPVLRELALGHRAWIEGVFDDADQAAKEALEAEAAPPAAPAAVAPAGVPHTDP